MVREQGRRTNAHERLQRSCSRRTRGCPYPKSPVHRINWRRTTSEGYARQRRRGVTCNVSLEVLSPWQNDQRLTLNRCGGRWYADTLDLYLCTVCTWSQYFELGRGRGVLVGPTIRHREATAACCAGLGLCEEINWASTIWHVFWRGQEWDRRVQVYAVPYLGSKICSSCQRDGKDWRESII